MQRQKKRVKTDKIMSADSWRLKTKMTDHFLSEKRLVTGQVEKHR